MDIRNLLRGTLIAVTSAALTAVFVATALPVSGQGQTNRAPARIGGKPNLNGIWQTISEANYDIEYHMARPAMALRPGPYGPVPAKEVIALGAVGSVPPGVGILDGQIPYKPEALKKRDENQQNWISRDPEIKCYQPGVPRATYMPQPFQIIHSEKAVFIAYQYAGAARNIYMEDPGPAPVDSWMGHSYGKWEGDTLVVDATGFNDLSWFDRSGNFHSDALHVVERYTPQGSDVILYEATIEDPNVFTKPWKISMPIYRRLDKGARLLDFRCVEFVEEMLFGAHRKNPLSQ